MKSFIVIYHVNTDAEVHMKTVPTEDQAKGLEGWMNWANKCDSQLVDMGAPLTGGQTLTRDGKSKDSNNGVRGYSILQSENMEEAKRLLQGHPHCMWSDGCTIELHEINVASEI